MYSILILVVLISCAAVSQVGCQQGWKGDRVTMLKQLRRLERILTKINAADAGFVQPAKHSAQITTKGPEETPAVSGAECSATKFQVLAPCCKDQTGIVSSVSKPVMAKCQKHASINASSSSMVLLSMYFVNHGLGDAAKLDLLKSSNSPTVNSFGTIMVSSDGSVKYDDVKKLFLPVSKANPALKGVIDSAVDKCKTPVTDIMKKIPGKLTPAAVKKECSVLPLVLHQCVMRELLQNCPSASWDSSAKCAELMTKLKSCDPFSS